MATAQTTPVGNRRVTALPKSQRDWLSEITTKPVHRPSAIAICGPPHVGKSSTAGNAPGAVALPFTQEMTWSLLKGHGAVPASLPVLPPAETWNDLMGILDALETGEHKHKVLIIDTIGNAERLCHEHVCNVEYNGEWGKKGFANYQQGFDVALAEWRLFLAALDRLRDKRGMALLLIAHTKVETFKNPEGADYDRYVPDVHKKTWALTHRWTDAVLFANFYVHVEQEKGERAKGHGGQQRILYTEYHAAYEAKNRFGLPPEIDMGNSGAEAWNNLKTAMAEARKDK